MIKRFASSELGESASRRVGYDFKAEYAKSGRSTCKVCRNLIENKELRLALLLQDDEGYKNESWCHFECFWKHKESKKLESLSEIVGYSKLKPADKTRISERFNSRPASTPSKGKKRKAEDDDEEEFEGGKEEEEEQSAPRKSSKKKKARY